MKTIPVHASGSYQVHIGAGLLASLGALTAQVISARKAAVISDTNVWQRYGAAAEKTLKNAGFHVCSYIFSPGENSKNSETFLCILNFLAENSLHRDDCIIALGGGVVGDLAGFCASCYLRGIPYIQAPTSLLAMVDSSVGGKTAIDLPAGKNLCGTFYQPNLVLCDLDTLRTLPEENFREGCAEIIKYGILYDPALFAHLEEKGMDFDRESVISRCVEWKRNTVEADEFDNGGRKLLNLGHTVGHAVEAQSNYRISHGNAVAIGIATVSRAAMKAGFCSEETCKQILSVLKKFQLPTYTSDAAEALYSHMLSDKKAVRNAISLIIPRQIGSCHIVPVDNTQLLDFLKAGL